MHIHVDISDENGMYIVFSMLANFYQDIGTQTQENIKEEEEEEEVLHAISSGAQQKRYVH
jgi:hypothetical protein